MEIDPDSSLLIMAAWDGAKAAALASGCREDPLEMWLRRGDQELRDLTVAIAIDVYTAVEALNPNFRIPSRTQPLFAYLAVAWFQVSLRVFYALGVS